MSIACRSRNSREIASAFPRISMFPPVEDRYRCLRRLIERRLRVLRRDPAQVARLGLVERPAAMNRAAIVPDHEIADPPAVAVDEFGLCRVLDQLADQQHAVRHRPADDMRGMRGEIQRLAPGTWPGAWTATHEALPHRRHRGAFLVA